MQVDELLKLIETVDHTDRKQMFDLNEAVYEWLLSNGVKAEYGSYVSSRDALKAIRPGGWRMRGNALLGNGHFSDGHYCSIVHPDFQASEYPKGVYFTASQLPTEELAELHAIISAITWERSK